MKIFFFLIIHLFLFINLNGQVSNVQIIDKGKSIKHNASYNLDELKVRWKKAALENCHGVPCVTYTVPGAPTGVVATAGNASASVAFMAPSNDGGSAITGYTVTSHPGGFTGTGTITTINVTGLMNGTAYTFTVVATNASGNSVPSAASTAVTPLAPVCTSSIVFDGDGNAYQTIAIGTQCWTKENLKTTKYNDGVTIIPDETANAGWGTLNYGARTEYDATRVTNYVSTYGYLYNWYATAGIITGGGPSTNNICPIGWHVPTDTDWTKLTDTLGVNPAGKLKESSNLWSSNTGTDDYGFSARPGGARFNDVGFDAINHFAFFWSATPSGSNAWYRYLNTSDDSYMYRVNLTGRSSGFSVRCLMD
jgi:uncharacterized protein (TIGR02145 family)